MVVRPARARRPPQGLPAPPGPPEAVGCIASWSRRIARSALTQRSRAGPCNAPELGGRPRTCRRRRCRAHSWRSARSLLVHNFARCTPSGLPPPGRLRRGRVAAGGATAGFERRGGSPERARRVRCATGAPVASAHECQGLRRWEVRLCPEEAAQSVFAVRCATPMRGKLEISATRVCPGRLHFRRQHGGYLELTAHWLGVSITLRRWEAGRPRALLKPARARSRARARVDADFLV